MRKRRASKAMGPNQIRDGAYNEQQKDSANPACICPRTPVANTLPRPVLRHDQSIIGVNRIRRTLAQGASVNGPRGNMEATHSDRIWRRLGKTRPACGGRFRRDDLQSSTRPRPRTAGRCLSKTFRRSSIRPTTRKRFANSSARSRRGSPGCLRAMSSRMEAARSGSAALLRASLTTSLRCTRS